MIVGQKILDLQLVKGGSRANLKNSTFDLTIGTIIPIGKDVEAKKKQLSEDNAVYLEPREMVWVLSKEEFNIPATVTGLATLRTTFTKDGLLALNVGIIDPFFCGPISTALINFSDRPRRIQEGDKFFRLIFFEHDDITEYHDKDESVDKVFYLRSLREKSHADFAPSFLNIPSFDDKYYYDKFWTIIASGVWKNKVISVPLLIVILIFIWFQIEMGFGEFLWQKYEVITNFIKHFTTG